MLEGPRSRRPGRTASGQAPAMARKRWPLALRRSPQAAAACGQGGCRDQRKSRARSDLVRLLGQHGGERSLGARRNIVKTWTEHLEIGECALITFNTTAELFKVDGKPFLDFRGSGGRANRALMLAHLDGLRPGGGTNTLSIPHGLRIEVMREARCER